MGRSTVNKPSKKKSGVAAEGKKPLEQSRDSRSSSKQLRSRVKELEHQLADTARDLAETSERLRSSREEWERTFDAVPDLLMILDRNHQIVMVNKATADALGVSKEQAVGRRCFECFHSTDGPWHVCPHSRLIADGTEHREELELPNFGGTFFVTVSPIHDAQGRVVGGIHIARDITYRKQAEAAIRESEERFRQIAENIREVFWLALPDKERRFIYVSPACRQVCGRTQDELCTDSRVWLSLIHPDDRGTVVAKYRDFLDGCCDFSAEYRVVRPDGLTNWVWDRASIVNDDVRGERRVAGVMQDVTSRRAAQERQQQLIEELKHFAYFVSHDLRGPLANLKGFAGEIRLGIDALRSALDVALEHLPESERSLVLSTVQDNLPEALSFIDSSVTRMDRLIKGVVRLSRLGRRELVFERIDMGDLVKRVLNSMALQIGRSAAEVVVGSLPEIIADVISMEQIVANLLDNAIKYLDPSRPGRIEITGERLDEETLFRVIDNGRGIDKAHLSKIFDMFERLGVSDVPGEGMGLSQVRTLIWRHGGRIWCDSTPGIGSSFMFTIAHGACEHW
ncbi:MAG: PAS domain S-box protein [Desulfomonile sp.]|nr:PAS domain S-box protein [Desulfomonile sp.]